MTPRPEPLFLGTPDAPLFGWLHRPTPEHSKNIGLVICNPYGYEAICAHRALRRLAVEAAQAGITTLRFDYHGTGDSSGNDLDPARVDAWLSSVHSAIGALRMECGAVPIALAGVRLGASLAMLVASRRGDIDALISVVPVVDGRAYLRELRALQIAAGQQPDSSCPHVAQEAIGFNLTAETQQSLREMDLTKLSERPAPRTLLFAKSETFGIQALTTRLAALGSTVTLHDPVGYTEMMLDAHEAQVPEALWAMSLAWLQEHLCPAQEAKSPPVCHSTLQSQALIASAGHQVREEAIFIDDDPSAFAIVTSHPALARQPKAVILLNAGAVHHAGPNRMYVELARRWAREDLVIMRLDLSGLGDSAPRSEAEENIVYSPHANDDVARAVEYLRKRFGTVDVESIGLCSGGYHALKAVSAGVALRRVTLINPLTFFWREGMSTRYPQYRVIADAQRYKKNAFQLSSWLKMIKGQVDMRAVVRVGLAAVSKLAWRTKRRLARLLRHPLKNDLGFELDRLGKRGVALAFVFAIGEPGLEMLESLGGSIVRRLEARNQLQIDMIDNADHTFTICASREQLIELLTKRVASNTDVSLS
ncbi:MAG TPA: alpha/beta hydrolase [Steroidobacteraceae bacterium]|nr:alpha/beta hydrolase [Steroidobacteraceae bacterium]